MYLMALGEFFHIYREREMYALKWKRYAGMDKKVWLDMGNY